MNLTRCEWATTELSILYHDEEWGVPQHDDRALFELLTLEGAQAGLSWETILKKRANYRAAFHGFDPAAVARYGPHEVDKLLADPGIVRHRGKIESTLANARAVLDLQDEYGSFGAYIWRFVDGRPKRNAFRSLRELPAQTPESKAMSRDMKKRGFRFVGPTTCYAFMQAAGLVNDHIVACFRYGELG